LGLDTVCSDLETEGYTVESFIIPACAIGSNHRRDRLWIVAYSESVRVERRWGFGVEVSPLQTGQVLSGRSGSGHNSGDMQTEPKLSGGHDGVPRRMDGHRLKTVPMGIEKIKGKPQKHWKDRIKALGNAIVPQIAFEIFRNISLVEIGVYQNENA